MFIRRTGVASMGYTTITFMIFMLLVTAAYYMFPVKKYQWTVLLVASYIFYLWASWKYAAFLLFTTFTVYFAALIMYKNSRIEKETIVLQNGEWNREQKKQYKEKMKKKRKRVLIMVLVLNFGILIFLKYFNLFAGGMNRFLGKAGMTGSVPILHLVLPLGISFYTFQSAGYLIDVYREKLNLKEILQNTHCLYHFFHRSFRDRSAFMISWRISFMQNENFLIEI